MQKFDVDFLKLQSHFKAIIFKANETILIVKPIFDRKPSMEFVWICFQAISIKSC